MAFRPDQRFAADSALLKNLISSQSYNKDEGYSEETRSQAGSDVNFRGGLGMEDAMDHDQQILLPDFFLSMPEVERTEYVYVLLRALRTSSVADIVDRLHPLLHLDPVLRLPNEIMYGILHYLSSEDLLRASMLSKTWRSRALDSELWRTLFKREGWVADPVGIRSYIAAERNRILRSKGRKMRCRPSISDIDAHVSKKRASVKDVIMSETRLIGAGDAKQGWAVQHSQVEADDSPIVAQEQDAQMEDVEQGFASLPISDDRVLLASPPSPTHHLHPPVKPELLVDDPGRNLRVNWQFLFKQKRRLEENWNAGKFTNFQLPHPSHPEEGHAECVYTIQYSPAHLVSGSRDRTIRIWDLETQRLKHILKGHDASVLCLQFDEAPEHDLVASGGSDSHVLLWKFSTGQLIKRLHKAHDESVLNLRFDEHFLVTCSKDKTIKIWNRKALLPDDPDYPSPLNSNVRYPNYILSMEAIEQHRVGIKPIPEFSLLMTLLGHTAAVNAIQILEGQIVSASGDRTVKLWDVKSGLCLKTITGHLKGIACVQYDGRRIVSGSSDDSVRIFDRVTGAEVACLRGHSNLVRTVQARFGDVPGNDDDLEAEARAIDLKFFEAQAEGLLNSDRPTREQRRERNAGSSDPKDICVWGAKIPPGGGGTRWARIVSGSYDESVIIWRRNAEGRWTPLHRLNQQEAVVSAGGRPRAAPSRPPAQQTVQGQVQAGAHAAGQANPQQPQAQSADGVYTTTVQSQHVVQPHPVLVGNASAALHVSSPSPAQQSLSAIAGPSGASPRSRTSNGTAGSTSASIAGPSNANAGQAPVMQQLPHHPGAIQLTWSNPSHSSAQQQQQQPPLATLANVTAAQPTLTTTTTTQVQGTLSTSQISTPTQASVAGPSQAANLSQMLQAGNHQQAAAAVLNAYQAQAQAQAQLNPHHHHHHHHANQRANGNNSRIFKLQFDSRRVVCCSQDPTIVGWDFANGDEEIIIASKFFGEEL